MKQSIFKRSKNAWPIEQMAQNDVCEKQNTTSTSLEAAHTSTQWAWKQTSSSSKTLEFSISSKEKSTEQEAILVAMNDLETFENNLKPDHTADNWVFSKVRG